MGQLFFLGISVHPIDKSGVPARVDAVSLIFTGDIMKTFCVRNAVMFLAAAAVAFSALAKDSEHKLVDGNAAKAVASGNTWESKKVGIGGYAYWEWKADGSVCMRSEEKTGKCTDTGTWKMDGDRLCWQLEWYGGDLGFKSNCVRLSDKGKGRYLGIDDQGSTMFDFTVLK